jgi:glyoxylase-like metal-dependent hydrolase (beta-lactamase superfamily II)
MGPTLGMLTDNLRSMGIGPEDIDTVLMTHLHPDHVNGLVDEHGQAVFPKAELVMNEAELNFFCDPDSPSRSPLETLEFFEGARLATAPYADRIRTVRDGPVLPGVTAVTQAGHTPGQTAWLIESGSESLMIWGDVVHMPNLQMAAPHAGTVLDIDRWQAVATRSALWKWRRRTGSVSPAPISTFPRSAISSAERPASDLFRRCGGRLSEQWGEGLGWDRSCRAMRPKN